MSNMTWCGATGIDTLTIKVFLGCGICSQDRHSQLALFDNRMVTSPIICLRSAHWNELICEVGRWLGCNKKRNKRENMVTGLSSDSSSACRFVSQWSPTLLSGTLLLLVISKRLVSIQDHTRYLKRQKVLNATVIK